MDVLNLPNMEVLSHINVALMNSVQFNRVHPYGRETRYKC